MKFSVTAFQGAFPRIAPNELPATAAQEARNTRLTSGTLRPLNSPSLYSTAPRAGTVSTYVLGPPGGATVLSWTIDTDIARSPVSDNEYRIYYTDGVQPRKTTLALASSGGGPYPTTDYNMGVPAPASTTLPVMTSLVVAAGTATATFTSAHGLATGNSILLSGFTPAGLNGTAVVTVLTGTTLTFTTASTTATVIGTSVNTGAMIAVGSTASGSIPAGTWVYVFTYVTQLGSVLLEESAPSAAVTVTLGATGNVALTAINSPGSTTGYNYVYKRIYRTLGTTFQLAAQIPFANTTYTDTLSATQIPGDALATSGWLPPPTDLKGLVAMPSGTMAGFRNNEIWFCEPGFPHAWPVKYMQALDSQIVAIKAFGNNLAVATQANPYVGNGVYPDSFTFQKVPRLEPCVSKRSMAGDESGALYASRNGLIMLGMNGDSIATSDILTRIEFADYTPDTMLGFVFENRYYGFYTTGAKSGAFVYSRAEQTGMRTLEIGATAVAIEPVTAQMLYVDKTDGKMYYMDPVGTVPMTYYWKSKLFNAPFSTNFGYIQVLRREANAADTAAQNAINTANAAIIAANAAVYAAGTLGSALNGKVLNGYALNGSALQPLIPSITQTVGLYVYAAGTLVFSTTANFNQVYTLPSGFKALGWEVALSGQLECSSVEFANSLKELKAS
jgi:hypothetical protein